MRIPKIFGERTEKEREPVKKYYLIYEGAKTEAQYFDGIIKNREKLNINSLIEMIPILRSYNEEDWSNPKKILDKLIEYINMDIKDKLTVELFIDKVIDWLIEEQIISDKGIYNKYNLKPVLLKLFEDENSIVELRIGAEMISNFLIKELGICDSVSQIEEYVNKQFVTYEPGFDKICLITDRDRQSFKEEQYDYVLNTCREKDYSFYVSNPCFEFWLLLHYDEILSMDREKLLNNPKERSSSKKRFLEKQLSTLTNGYNKNNIKINKFLDRIEIAIENEKNFCEDIALLKTELGCNIGALFKEII